LVSEYRTRRKQSVIPLKMRLNYVILPTEEILIEAIFAENKNLTPKNREGKEIDMTPDAKYAKLKELYEKKDIIKIPFRFPTASVPDMIEYYKLEKERLTLSDKNFRRDDVTLPTPNELRDTTQLIAALEKLDPKFRIDQSTIKVDNKIVVKEGNLADLIAKANETIESNLQASHDNQRLKEQIDAMTNACESNESRTDECWKSLAELQERHNKLKIENNNLKQDCNRAQNDLNEASKELAEAIAESEMWKNKNQTNSKPFDIGSEHSGYRDGNKQCNNDKSEDQQSTPENSRQKEKDNYLQQDDNIWTNTFLEDKAKPTYNRVNVNNLKVSLKIPIWENTPSIDKTSSLNDYIDKLRYFRSMNILTDAETIYSSLEASNRIDILRELDQDTLKSIEKFVRYLRMAHGGSALKQRSNLESLIQAPLESALSFFKRCIREYFLSKGLEPKDPKDITEKDRQEDIVYHFSRGLRNNTTGTQIRMNRMTTSFTKLGEIANHIDQALEPIHTVNSTQLMEHVNRIAMTESNHEVNTFTRDYKSDYNKSRQCWTCGYYGHESKDCYANQRTQGRYQRQSRNKSRDRYEKKGFSRSPYRKSNDNNRGRSPYRKSEGYRGRDNTPYNRNRQNRSNSNNSYRGRSSSFNRNRNDSRERGDRRSSGSRDRGNSGSRERRYSRERRSSSRESRTRW
jgi:hypothetical protein